MLSQEIRSFGKFWLVPIFDMVVHEAEPQWQYMKCGQGFSPLALLYTCTRLFATMSQNETEKDSAFIERKTSSEKPDEVDVSTSSVVQADHVSKFSRILCKVSIVLSQWGVETHG